MSLIRRGCEVDSNCKICGFKEEDATHVFLGCWGVRVYWGYLQVELPEVEAREISISEWICWKGSQCSSDIFRRICVGMWMIWNNRNKVWHGGDISDAKSSAIRTELLLNQWSMKESLLHPGCYVHAERWAKPEKNVVKINCDGSWSGERKRMGHGVIARDEFGVVHRIMMGGEDGGGQAMEAEGRAVRIAMELAEACGWNKVVFESDSHQVLDAILRGGGGTQAQCQNWILKCVELMARHGQWRLSLVPRVANGCADLLARKAMEENWSWSRSDALPLFVGRACIKDL